MPVARGGGGSDDSGSGDGDDGGDDNGDDGGDGGGDGDGAIAPGLLPKQLELDFSLVRGAKRKIEQMHYHGVDPAKSKLRSYSQKNVTFSQLFQLNESQLWVKKRFAPGTSLKSSNLRTEVIVFVYPPSKTFQHGDICDAFRHH